MSQKSNANEAKERITRKRESGEIIVHKMMSLDMSVGEKFRYNLCLKIQEIKLSLALSNESFESDGVSSEEMNRIQHKHYDYFKTDRLLEILNVALLKSGQPGISKIAI